MKMYFASCYSDKEMLLKYAEELESKTSDKVISSWLRDKEGDGFGETTDVKRLAKEALKDRVDVLYCDMIVVFTHEAPTKGGRYVEMGMAIASGKSISIIGPRSNVFAFLPEVTQYHNWEEFLTQRMIFSV